MDRVYHEEEEKGEGVHPRIRLLEKAVESTVKKLREGSKADRAVLERLEAFENTMREIVEEVKRKVLRAIDPLVRVDEALMEIKKEIEREKQEWKKEGQWEWKEMELHTEKVRRLMRRIEGLEGAEEGEEVLRFEARRVRDAVLREVEVVDGAKKYSKE